MRVGIFIDFDGTITCEDVGDKILRNHAVSPHWWYWNEVWKNKEVGSRIALTRQFLLVRASEKEILQTVDSVSFDLGFKKLVELCKRKGWHLEILSDGQLYYIERILNRENLLKEVKIRANIGKITEEGIKLEFPYFNPECPLCGNCKRKALEEFTGFKVYVGDGLSDRCPSEAADLVFAKEGKDLQRYLSQINKKFISFKNLEEVSRCLENLTIEPRGLEACCGR